MPAHRLKEELSLQRIEKVAVEAASKKVSSNQIFKRNTVSRDWTIGERGPTRQEYLIGVLNNVNFLHLSSVVEEIVAIERPLIEGRDIMIADSSVIQQQRRPAQAMKNNAILAGNPPPSCGTNYQYPRSHPIRRPKFAMEPVDGRMDHLTAKDDERQSGFSAILVGQQALLVEMSQKWFLPETQSGCQHELGAITRQLL